MKKITGFIMCFLLVTSMLALPVYASEIKYPYSYDFENGLVQISKLNI